MSKNVRTANVRLSKAKLSDAKPIRPRFYFREVAWQFQISLYSTNSPLSTSNGREMT